MTNGVERTVKNSVILLIICVFGWFTAGSAHAEPPFAGTIFLDGDILLDRDPATFTHLVEPGQEMRRMFDRRVNGRVSVNAFLFNASYSDGLVTEIQVNPEFGTRAAAFEQASRFAPVIGRLPTCLRADVQTVWIHKGVLPGFPGDFSLGKNGVTTMTAPKNAGKPGCGRFDRKAARAGARRSPPCSF